MPFPSCSFYTRAVLFASLISGIATAPSLVAAKLPVVSCAKLPGQPLNPDCFRHYVTTFRAQEQKATGKIVAEQSTDDPWPWMAKNIPFFTSSDKQFEEIYYFRWYALQKHLQTTDRGRLISEFLVPVKWAGYAQTIVDAAPHHLRELRWLRNDTAAEDYARFWSVEPDAAHAYSVPLASAVLSVVMANGDKSFAAAELPSLKQNYKVWEETHRDANGLFWSIDTRDGMEVSISGDGYRPTLNSYMYGDAHALEQIEMMQGNLMAAKEYAAKAATLQTLVNNNLWNSKDQFFEVMSPAQDSGIRKEKKFKDRNSAMQIAGVRELIGYTPWYFDLPSPEAAAAWKQISDKAGFSAPFGPFSAERRSPRFRYADNDQCQWNGPSWAFATTQTLIGLSNLLNGPPQNFIAKDDFYRLFEQYVHGHQWTTPGGATIPWIDEAEDGETGEWITKNILVARNSPLIGRGSYYNHSGFADPLITGLVGLRPRVDDIVELNPLVPPGKWTYFALQDVPYHGHLLTITYDGSGKHFPRGLRLSSDGKLLGSRPSLGKIEAHL